MVQELNLVPVIPDALNKNSKLNEKMIVLYIWVCYTSFVCTSNKFLQITTVFKYMDLRQK